MTGRPASCACDVCAKCRARIRARAAYQALSVEERRAIVARRDPERVRANDAARFRRDRAKRLAAMAAYSAANPEVGRRAKAAWRARNPEKRAAHNAVANAIRDGRLTRQPCEACGATPTHAHHDDYSRPLDVRWLCAAHHGETWRRVA